MFIPRRESAKADIPYGVHLSILYFISRFHEGYSKSRFPPLKLKCQNVLSPEGSCESRTRMGSNCFYLCFIVFQVGSRRGYLKCRFPPLKLKCKNVLLCPLVRNAPRNALRNALVIFYPFSFSSFSSMITSIISCFQKSA